MSFWSVCQEMSVLADQAEEVRMELSSAELMKSFLPTSKFITLPDTCLFVMKLLAVVLCPIGQGLTGPKLHAVSEEPGSSV